MSNRSGTPKPGSPHPIQPKPGKPRPNTSRPPTKPGGKTAAMHRHPGGRTCAGAFPLAAFLTVVAMVRHVREIPALWRETATGGTR